MTMIPKSYQKCVANKISDYLVQFKKIRTKFNLTNKNNMFCDNDL